MANCEFTDGIKRLLRGNAALPAESTRGLAVQFNAAQKVVCQRLAELGYPLERVAQELREGRLQYFREGSDQDRKRNTGKKSSHRFAGIAPSHLEEFEGRLADLRNNAVCAADFAAWEAGFIMGFTFDVIEQAALRAFPLPDGPAGEGLTAPLTQALAEARSLRDEILLGNLLLVAKIVMRRGGFRSPVALDDLFTAGTDGLQIAIGRYDPTVGLFSTYATPWVAMAIDRFVAKTRSVIRIPIGLQDKVRRQRRLETGPDAPVAAFSPIPEVQSLEDPLPGFADGELRLEDIVADPQAAQPRLELERSDIASILRGRMLEMDELRQFIIAMRNDIGDPAVLGAGLFRGEIEESLSRGRATAAAAVKAFEEPALIRVIAAPDPAAAPAPRLTLVDTSEPGTLELAV
jgi:hypothetical protein